MDLPKDKKMDSFRIETNNLDNNNVEISKVELTLGSLFKQDIPAAYILPVYPSSFSDKYRFKNETKYRIFFIIPNISAKRLLLPLRYCCVAGDELPILVHKLPDEFLSAHWRKWLPSFREPVIKTIEEGIADPNPLITLFPLEEIPREKHAVNPEMHYHILEKAAVAETGAPYPRRYTEDDVVFPCMIKV